MSTNNTNRIELYISGDSWVAAWFGPEMQRIVELFGTNALPTAFTSHAMAGTVKAAIARKNPGFEVVIR